jgi:hypothetical protein
MVAVGLAAFAAGAQTADDIVNKHIQAMGGLDKIKSVKTLRMTGKMVMGQGMEAPMTIETARPNKLRVEFTFQGMTGVQGFDGTKGWQVMPFMGKTEPEELPAEQVEQMKEQADIDGLLVGYKDKGSTVEYLGKGDLEGTPVEKIKLTKKNGDVVTFFIDAESYLVLKQAAKITMMGQQVEGEAILGDYKQVDGITYPFSMEQKAQGAPGAGMVMSFEKIEVNPELDGSRFDMPKVEAKPAAAPPPPQQ